MYRSPLYNNDGDISVENNRFVAWHLGVSGEPTSQLSYRVLATYQTGYGTYSNPIYPKQHQGYVLAEGIYKFNNGWSIKGGIGFDFGKLTGDNSGIQLTIIKRGVL